MGLCVADRVGGVYFWGPLYTHPKHVPQLGSTSFGELVSGSKWHPNWGPAFGGSKPGSVSWSHRLNPRLCVSVTEMAVSLRMHRSPIPDGVGRFLVVMVASGGGGYSIEGSAVGVVGVMAGRVR